jgi:hypothetical protein
MEARFQKGDQGILNPNKTHLGIYFDYLGGGISSLRI